MQVNRRVLLGASAIGMALAAGCTAAQNGDLNTVLNTLSTEILKDTPEYATALGVSEEQAGGPYKNRLSDLSVEGKAESRAVGTRALAALATVDRSKLSAADAVTYDVVKTALEDNDAVSAFAVGSGGANSPYVVSQLQSSAINIPDFLDSQHNIADRSDADAYLERLTAYARQLDQESACIASDAAAGVIPPDFAIDGATNVLRGLVGQTPAQTVLVQSINRKLGEIEGFPAADRTALTTQAETIVREQVLPAYQRQIDALAAIRPQAVHDAGCWRLPRGEEMYAAALKSNTTTNMTPDEVHNIGVELVNQFMGEMDAILKSQGMDRGTVAERVQALYTRPGQVYPNNDAGRAQLLTDLNAMAAAMTARMPEFCNTLARAPLEIKRVPPEIEAGAPGGYYQGASLDGSRPGAYYINLRDTGEVPRFTLPTLTYHEGIPGHHWQISIQQESQGLPFIRSAILGFNAYAEGWGLYAEQLADEMGVYANDPLGRVGYLQSAVFRASRLVVDTGMHAKRWSREQAIQSMMAATGDKESNVVTEIERYSVIPGQACGYMVGRQAIGRMREEARTALGDRFDIKGFHDAVLVNGSTPLSVTEQLVREWTASVGRA